MEQPKKKTIIIASSILAIVFVIAVIIILIVVLNNGSSTDTSTSGSSSSSTDASGSSDSAPVKISTQTNTGSGSGSGSGSSSGSSSGTSTPPADQNIPVPYGIWMYGDVPPDFNNGLDYEDSVDYCKGADGVLASSDDLKRAGKQGYSPCALGWLEEKIVGIYAYGPTCPGVTPGYYTPEYPFSTTEMANAYCMGPIPSDIDKNNTMVLSKQ